MAFPDSLKTTRLFKRTERTFVKSLEVSSDVCSTKQKYDSTGVDCRFATGCPMTVVIIFLLLRDSGCWCLFFYFVLLFFILLLYSVLRRISRKRDLKKKKKNVLLGACCKS